MVFLCGFCGKCCAKEIFLWSRCGIENIHHVIEYAQMSTKSKIANVPRFSNFPAINAEVSQDTRPIYKLDFPKDNPCNCRVRCDMILKLQAT